MVVSLIEARHYREFTPETGQELAQLMLNLDLKLQPKSLAELESQFSQFEKVPGLNGLVWSRLDTSRLSLIDEKFHATGKLLWLFSGIPAAGKGTIWPHLAQTYQDWMAPRPVSATTRPIRAEQGELDGVDYHFMTQDEFDALDNQGQLVERVDRRKLIDGQSVLHSYGLPVASLEAVMAAPEPLINIEMEVTGWRKLNQIASDRTDFPPILRTFILPYVWGGMRFEYYQGADWLQTWRPKDFQDRAKIAAWELIQAAELADVLILNPILEHEIAQNQTGKAASFALETYLSTTLPGVFG